MCDYGLCRPMRKSKKLRNACCQSIAIRENRLDYLIDMSNIPPVISRLCCMRLKGADHGHCQVH